jgi:hypothetical protein
MTEKKTSAAGSAKPTYVTDLEKAYGAPSQEGFGSAVFFEQLKSDAYLEKEALAKYKYFVGEQWDRLGGDKAWLGPWKKVYSRKSGAKGDVVNELKGIDDFDAQLSVPMILESVENADAAVKALAAVYDDPSVTDFTVHNTGDGGAMSGLVLSGRRTNGETTFLVFLMD